MKNLKTGAVACSLACMMTGVAAVGYAGSAWSGTLAEALAGGKPVLNARLRHEYVDQDNAFKDANAVTLRTRLGYGTADYHGFDMFVEFSNTTALVDDFNSGPGGNGNTLYSVVADPDLTEVDQAWIGYSGLPDTLVRAGRQRIILDNARFLGNVGWRQNEQTYDAASISNTALPDTTLYYAYLDNVQNIFGAAADTKSHMLNVKYAGLEAGTLSAYGYFVEFPNSKSASQKTVGLRFSGASEVSDAKLLYTAEFARQSDYQQGSSLIDADYHLLELGVAVNGITAKLGYEQLGADDAFSFETPFATKHAFNGWADVFLNTPDSANSPMGQGLKDLYAVLTGKIAGIKLLAVYHKFESDSGSADFGSEIDLLAAKKFGKHYSAGIKYAAYDAEDFGVDTDKFWVWGGIKF